MILRVFAGAAWLASVWLGLTLFAFATQSGYHFRDMDIASQIGVAAPAIALLIAGLCLLRKQRSPWSEIAALSALIYQAAYMTFHIFK